MSDNIGVNPLNPQRGLGGRVPRNLSRDLSADTVGHGSMNRSVSTLALSSGPLPP